jgi:hypothetical protein
LILIVGIRHSSQGYSLILCVGGESLPPHKLQSLGTYINISHAVFCHSIVIRHIDLRVIHTGPHTGYTTYYTCVIGQSAQWFCASASSAGKWGSDYTGAPQLTMASHPGKHINILFKLKCI